MFGLISDIFRKGMKPSSASQIKQPQPPSSGESFFMTIDAVFGFDTYSVAVTGTIESGSVAVDQEVSISSVLGKHKVRGIEVNDQQKVEARTGDRATLLFSGTTDRQVSEGDIVSG